MPATVSPQMICLRTSGSAADLGALRTPTTFGHLANLAPSTESARLLSHPSGPRLCVLCGRIHVSGEHRNQFVQAVSSPSQQGTRQEHVHSVEQISLNRR